MKSSTKAKPHLSHRVNTSKHTGASCRRCGDRYPYVVRKGVEYCSHCGEPLPSSARRFVSFAFITLTRQVTA